MNRHDVVTLAILAVLVAVVAVTAAIVAGSFYAPAFVTDVVGTEGYLLSLAALVGVLAGAVVFGDRLRTWLRRRYELGDVSPDSLPER